MFVVGREGEKKVGVGQITQRNNRESKAVISAGQWVETYLCFRCYYWLWRELHFSSFEDSIFL